MAPVLLDDQPLAGPLGNASRLLGVLDVGGSGTGGGCVVVASAGQGVARRAIQVLPARARSTRFATTAVAANLGEPSCEPGMAISVEGRGWAPE